MVDLNSYRCRYIKMAIRDARSTFCRPVVVVVIDAVVTDPFKVGVMEENLRNTNVTSKYLCMYGGRLVERRGWSRNKVGGWILVLQ